MRRVAARIPEVRLRLYDRQAEDDPAFLARFEATGATCEWHEKTRYRDYIASFEDVSVGLAPLSQDTPFSRGKAFGKVLAYLDRRVPVVASDVGEYAAFFEPGCGIVSGALDVWSDEIIALLGDAARRQKMADLAFERFKARLSLAQAARETDRILRRIIT